MSHLYICTDCGGVRLKDKAVETWDCKSDQGWWEYHGEIPDGALYVWEEKAK